MSQGCRNVSTTKAVPIHFFPQEFFTLFLKEVSVASADAKPVKPAKPKRALDSAHYKKLKSAFDLVSLPLPSLCPLLILSAH